MLTSSIKSLVEDIGCLRSEAKRRACQSEPQAHAKRHVSTASRAKSRSISLKHSVCRLRFCPSYGLRRLHRSLQEDQCRGGAQGAAQAVEIAPGLDEPAD